MSHCPGVWLEDFITDWFRCVDGPGEHGTGIRRLYKGQKILSREQFAELVAVLEPHREDVEQRLCGYEEEDHGSWRDWSSYAFTHIEESPEFGRAEKLLAAMDTPETHGLLP